jgi:hypothetical protein
LSARSFTPVLDGAIQRETESFKNEFGLDIVAMAEPEG